MSNAPKLGDLVRACYSTERGAFISLEKRTIIKIFRLRDRVKSSQIIGVALSGNYKETIRSWILLMRKGVKKRATKQLYKDR